MTVDEEIDLLMELEEIRLKTISTEELLKGYESPLRKYLPESQRIILDIGCGVSEQMLDLSSRNYSFTAVDRANEVFDFLFKRLDDLNPTYKDKVKKELGDFRVLSLHYAEADAIIMSDLLHFYERGESIDFFKPINDVIKKGAVIFIRVNSLETPLHRRNDVRRIEYFCTEYLQDIFPVSLFEPLYEKYFVHTEREIEAAARKKWLRVMLERQGKTEQEIQNFIHEAFTNDNEKYYSLDYIIRKR